MQIVKWPNLIVLHTHTYILGKFILTSKTPMKERKSSFSTVILRGNTALRDYIDNIA